MTTEPEITWPPIPPFVTPGIRGTYGPPTLLIFGREGFFSAIAATGVALPFGAIC